MKLLSVLLIDLPLGLIAATDDRTDRSKLVGSWVLDQGNGTSAGWTLSDTADGLRVVQTEGTQVVEDFSCSTDGRDCTVHVAGHKATVSLYYNGAALVELETSGGNVLKRRFAILPSGDSMKLEEIPISGKETSRELQFQRAHPPEQKH